MARRSASLAFAPWAGSIAAPLAWVIHHQGLADSLYFHCAVGDGGAPLVLGLALLALILGSMALSWSARGAGGDGAARNRRFIAGMSVGMGLLFGLAIIYQTLAGVILPGCAR